MATVSFELPESIEKQLREQLGNLDVAAKEAALVELYRLKKLTQHQLATALALDRLGTEAVLKAHDVSEDLITPDEFANQLSGLRRLLGG